MLLYSRNQHNIVKQLSSNLKHQQEIKAVYRKAEINIDVSTCASIHTCISEFGPLRGARNKVTPSVISWHQSSVIQRKESGFLGEVAKFRADSGKVQEGPGIPCGATK